MKVYNYVVVLVVFGLLGCSSDDANETEERFPFMANIEYLVSSSVGDATARLGLINEAKEDIEIQSEILPYRYSFDVNVEFGDTFYISALTSASNLKVTLLIDGVLIREVEGNDTSNNAESIVHQFGIVDVTSIER